MKNTIRITKEKEDMFFVELVGVEWVFAEGETLDQALSNLVEVYDMTIEYKKDMNQIKEKSDIFWNFDNSFQKTMKRLKFKTLEIEV